MAKITGTLFKVILGLILLGCAAFLLLKLEWWRETWFFFKGVSAPVLILAGIVVLAIAKE
jgi:hypothetical protein